VLFREEAGAGGERLGEYSYIDQTGQTITVRYSAGKDGFRILEGAHVPEGATGQNSAAYDPNYNDQHVQPQNYNNDQYVQPQNYNNDQYVQPQNYNNQQYVQPQQASNANPFINPNDPTHQDLRYNTNAAQFLQPSFRPGSAGVPPCADCEGVDPFVNPYDPSHQAGYVPPQQPEAAPLTQQNGNLSPPGKLNLNLFQNGFNFDFES